MHLFSTRSSTDGPLAGVHAHFRAVLSTHPLRCKTWTEGGMPPAPRASLPVEERQPALGKAVPQALGTLAGPGHQALLCGRDSFLSPGDSVDGLSSSACAPTGRGDLVNSRLSSCRAVVCDCPDYSNSASALQILGEV